MPAPAADAGGLVGERACLNKRQGLRVVGWGWACKRRFGARNKLKLAALAFSRVRRIRRERGSRVVFAALDPVMLTRENSPRSVPSRLAVACSAHARALRRLRCSTPPRYSNSCCCWTREKIVLAHALGVPLGGANRVLLGERPRVNCGPWTRRETTWTRWCIDTVTVTSSAAVEPSCRRNEA